MSKAIKMNIGSKMQKVDVRYRDEPLGLIKIDQLYCVLNGDYDIHVNGSVEMIAKDYGNLKNVKVYANLCNKDGAILYVLNGWKNYPISTGRYNSFSLYCSTVCRFFDPSELEYVEIYLSFNEED